MTLERALKQSIKKKKTEQQPIHLRKSKTGPEHIKLGEYGEDLAILYLQKHGYEILGRNVRFGRDEIDIVACIGDEIVFAEVRTRTLGQLSPPETTVGTRKIKKLLRSAHAWAEFRRYDGFWRIDLIAVTVIPGKENKIEHIKTITEAID